MGRGHFGERMPRVLELLGTDEYLLEKGTSPWKARGLSGALREVES